MDPKKAAAFGKKAEGSEHYEEPHIGKTTSGKPVFAPSQEMKAAAMEHGADGADEKIKAEAEDHVAKHEGFTSQDHDDAGEIHVKAAQKARAAFTEGKEDGAIAHGKYGSHLHIAVAHDKAARCGAEEAPAAKAEADDEDEDDEEPVKEAAPAIPAKKSLAAAAKLGKKSAVI